MNPPPPPRPLHPRLALYQASDHKDDTVQVLQAFLDHLPREGRILMERDISQMTDLELKQHMISLVHQVLMPMMARRTPITTPLSPRPGAQAEVENQYSEMIETADRLKILKAECLLRDDNKCTITLARDEENNPPNTPGDLCNTQCCHILPFSLSVFKSDAKARERAAVWVTLRRCFPILDSLAIRFTHNDINDHRNQITMDVAIHHLFGAFNFSLVATRIPNQYTIHLWKPQKLRLIRHITSVTFSAHGTRFPLPSPELIEIHHTVAQILHASGRAGWIRAVLDDLDDTSVLASDGSTNLTDLLWGTDLALMGGLIHVN
ncbi:hypothetical protein N7495_001634 [Penicillium taxi]|uniref:uncharacterized protein n=1 Tax=Penicillium taxi TaxID=168475 RepID=UPI0025452D0D|nr:uncharacterized protein N7495_001634 [Penicillium taxi]KAJ5908952.1 hypothetical protein N7495_001634 [Penicillium taxi]